MTDIEEAIALATDLGFPTYDHHFGKGSLNNLEGVHPDIINLAKLTIRLCKYDGTIIAGGGFRTKEQAEQNVANGTGILNSVHRKQADGYGHAVDVVPYVSGKATWTMMYCAEMSDAAKIASALLAVPIRQGCDWNMNGKFGESGEYDWCHHEICLEGGTYWERATAELARFREEIGINTEQADPGIEDCFRCPHCDKPIRASKP